MAKKNKFARCYLLFTLIAAKNQGMQMSIKNIDKNGLRLAVMIEKEKAKKEFGIKSLSELSGKRLQEFEKFLSEKL